jgi:hypothetical protein
VRRETLTVGFWIHVGGDVTVHNCCRKDQIKEVKERRERGKTGETGDAVFPSRVFEFENFSLFRSCAFSCPQRRSN